MNHKDFNPDTATEAELDAFLKSVDIEWDSEEAKARLERTAWNLIGENPGNMAAWQVLQDMGIIETEDGGRLDNEH